MSAAQPTSQCHQERGFTLVELILVMAILAVLVGIAVPKYGNVLGNAKIKADVTSRDLIQNAVDLYHIDHNIYPAGNDYQTLMANGEFVGADKYLQQKISVSHPQGEFRYVDSDGKVTYSNKNEKWNTPEKIKAVVPGYEP